MVFMFPSISLPLSSLKATELQDSVQERFDFISYTDMRPLSTEKSFIYVLSYTQAYIISGHGTKQTDNKIRINSCYEPSKMRLDNGFQGSQVAILVLSSLTEILTLLLISLFWVVSNLFLFEGKIMITRWEEKRNRKIKVCGIT